MGCPPADRFLNIDVLLAQHQSKTRYSPRVCGRLECNRVVSGLRFDDLLHAYRRYPGKMAHTNRPSIDANGIRIHISFD